MGTTTLFSVTAAGTALMTTEGHGDESGVSIFLRRSGDIVSKRSGGFVMSSIADMIAVTGMTGSGVIVMNGVVVVSTADVTIAVVRMTDGALTVAVVRMTDGALTIAGDESVFYDDTMMMQKGAVTAPSLFQARSMLVVMKY
jgi:hypothetical protein